MWNKREGIRLDVLLPFCKRKQRDANLCRRHIRKLKMRKVSVEMGKIWRIF